MPLAREDAPAYAGLVHPVDPASDRQDPGRPHRPRHSRLAYWRARYRDAEREDNWRIREGDPMGMQLLVMVLPAGVGALLAWLVSEAWATPWSWSLAFLFAVITLDVAAFFFRHAFRTRGLAGYLMALNLAALLLFTALRLADTLGR
ncbi:MAG: hypothetical protein ACC662_04035 [Planctomycetota bacterium]